MKAHLKREVRLGRFIQDMVEAAQEVTARTTPEERPTRLDVRFRQVIGLDVETHPDCLLSITCKDPVMSMPEREEGGTEG